MESKLKFTKKQIICLLAIGWLILLCGCAAIAYGQEQEHLIGTDSQNDLRIFDREWLEDEFDSIDWDDNDINDNLNEIWEGLDKNWDNEDACDTLEATKYEDNDYIDIIEIRVENLDQTKATLVVEVVGDASNADKLWFLFVWSDCGPDADGDDVFFFGFYIPEGLGGDETAAYEYGDDFDDDFHDLDFSEENDLEQIEMDFDSDIWEDVKDCNLRAMMITPEDDEDTESDYIIDIFPSEQILDLWWLWLLLLILILIAIAVLIYYLYRRNKRKKQFETSNKKLKR